LKKLGIPVIVSISAEADPREFQSLAEKLESIDSVSAIELNISCPNMQKDKLISQDARETYSVVKTVRGLTVKCLIAKLSPNVTSIAEIALAAEEAGSDAVSMVNTLSGMSIDVKKRSPKIGSWAGGLSGPAIRPVAVRMVWEAYKKIKIPIIGMGGIMDTESALEFIIAGASAVSIGTANFVNPATSLEIISGLRRIMRDNCIRIWTGLSGNYRHAHKRPQDHTCFGCGHDRRGKEFCRRALSKNKHF
jgi:dihydroorotate dehydrogenase (NAD+) catalytic subunit